MNNQFCKYIYECNNVRQKKNCFEDTQCNIKRFYDKYGTDYIRQTKPLPFRDASFGNVGDDQRETDSSSRDKTADSNLHEMFIGSKI